MHARRLRGVGAGTVVAMGLLMIKLQSVWPSAFVGIVIALSSSAGCGEGGLFGSETCTLVGCDSGTELSLPVNLSFAELTSATLEFCRAEACIITPLAELTPPSGGTWRSVTAPDEETLNRTRGDSLEVSLEQSAGMASGLSLEVRYNIRARTARDGDRYRVRLLAADGTAISLFDKTARYEDVEPNGPDCGPACKVADFQP